MFSAGGHVPTHTLAPASASSLAIANPKPASSATPATRARRPARSMLSIGQYMHRPCPLERPLHWRDRPARGTQHVTPEAVSLPAHQLIEAREGDLTSPSVPSFALGLWRIAAADVSTGNHVALLL